jgi:F420-dependent oxidoreductase-like protein
VKLSILFPETRNVERAIARIQELERLGFHSAVMGHAMDFDPIAVFALAGARTERILLTTAVVPLFSRHPISLAMSAATAQAASRGRFRLGIGPSHQPLVEHVYGLAYDKPVRRVREYVTIVRELLSQGATRFRGELYRVQAAQNVEGGSGVPVLVSALADQMCRAAGAVSDGVLPWLAPARYVAEHIVPAVRAGADAAGRSAPPIIAENACALASDPAAVRDAVRRDMGFYLAMPAYRALFERAGVPDVAGGPQTGWTDAMIEAVLPWGSETRLADAVEGYFKAGADEVVLSPVGVGSDPAANYERALQVLGELARAR